MTEERELIELYLNEKRAALERFPINETLRAADYIWESYKKN